MSWTVTEVCGAARLAGEERDAAASAGWTGLPRLLDGGGGEQRCDCGNQLVCSGRGQRRAGSSKVETGCTGGGSDEARAGVQGTWSASLGLPEFLGCPQSVSSRCETWRDNL